MRYVILGAGGVGGTVGARLHLNGYNVAFIARGEHGSVLQDKGLRFVSPVHDVTLPIPTFKHPREIEWQVDDVVLLCVKTQQTISAIEDLASVAPQSLPVVCCQNGVVNEQMVLRRMPRVYAMCILIPTEHLEPGVVVNFANRAGGTFFIGRYPGGVDRLSKEIARDLEASDIASEASEHAYRYKYGKLLMNLINGVEAITGEYSREMRLRLIEEAEYCFQAAGIHAVSMDDLIKLRRFTRGEVPGVARLGSSSLQSVKRQTGNIEVDYLNGEIVLLGRLHGVPTPANSVVQRLANIVSQRCLTEPYCSLQELEKLIDSESK